MFTGLIQDVGIVKSMRGSTDGKRITIEAQNLELEQEAIGASIACSGCCLTVVEKSGLCFSVDVSNESLNKTNILKWHEGTPVNLESSLRMGEPLGGHLVSGHIDGMATIKTIVEDGESKRLSIEPQNSEFMKYIASKGSVCLDGISLTVNEVNSSGFQVNIIPHTWENTNLKYKTAGDHLNLEIDMLARYVERMIVHRL